MEYLASGVPVITTCPGGMADEFGAFAYLLHEETPGALADIIKTVEAIPVEQRIARGKAARQYMIEHKTWDAQAKKIAHFLSEISGAKPRA
jgi:glycosyltransferase involved in cell wall biosynthesis